MTHNEHNNAVLKGWICGSLMTALYSIGLGPLGGLFLVVLIGVAAWFLSRVLG